MDLPGRIARDDARHDADLTKAGSLLATLEAMEAKKLGVIAASAGEAYLKREGEKLGVAGIKSYTS